MKYAVPRKIVKSASRCEHRHSCLKTGRCGERPMCPADHVFGVVFLKAAAEAECSYRTRSDGRPLCLCPVRGFIAQACGE